MRTNEGNTFFDHFGVNLSCFSLLQPVLVGDLKKRLSITWSCLVFLYKSSSSFLKNTDSLPFINFKPFDKEQQKLLVFFVTRRRSSLCEESSSSWFVLSLLAREAQVNRFSDLLPLSLHSPTSYLIALYYLLAT